MKIESAYTLNFDKPFDNLLFTPIYRVFSLEKFLTSLNSNQLFLFKAKHSEDTFEAFLLKQLIWKEDGSENYPFSELQLENFFIQSWTFLEESYLLWNAYAPNKDGIIVKSTIGKMADLFLKNNVSWGKFYLGKILYWTEDEIKKHYEDKAIVKKLMSDKAMDVLLKSLLIKRKPFMHEDEVRLLYVSNHDRGKDQKISMHGYTFESRHLFNELAEELVLDPRLDPIRADSIISLIKKIGYTGQIRKSTLYDMPYLKLRAD
jgi:hypothetical protein